MNKRFDFSVLPDGLIIEAYKPMPITRNYDWQLTRMWKGYRGERKPDFRPILNYNHFNDGSLVIPVGLVYEASLIQHDGFVFTLLCATPQTANQKHCIGVKIIGAHPDYADHAKELGIPVIDISEVK